MLPSTPNDLLLHYSKLLAAIFEAVAEFFSRPDIQNLSWKKDWKIGINTAFQTTTTKNVFSNEVLQKMKSLPDKISSVKYVEDASQIMDNAPFKSTQARTNPSSCCWQLTKLETYLTTSSHLIRCRTFGCFFGL
jgi:hypothetical protein